MRPSAQAMGVPGRRKQSPKRELRPRPHPFAGTARGGRRGREDRSRDPAQSHAGSNLSRDSQDALGWIQGWRDRGSPASRDQICATQIGADPNDLLTIQVPLRRLAGGRPRTSRNSSPCKRLLTGRRTHGCPMRSSTPEKIWFFSEFRVRLRRDFPFYRDRGKFLFYEADFSPRGQARGRRNFRSVSNSPIVFVSDLLKEGANVRSAGFSPIAKIVSL